jgi:hypothetical protein
MCPSRSKKGGRRDRWRNPSGSVPAWQPAEPRDRRSLDCRGHRSFLGPQSIVEKVSGHGSSRRHQTGQFLVKSAEEQKKKVPNLPAEYCRRTVASAWLGSLGSRLRHAGTAGNLPIPSTCRARGEAQVSTASSDIRRARRGDYCPSLSLGGKEKKIHFPFRHLAMLIQSAMGLLPCDRRGSCWFVRPCQSRDQAAKSWGPRGGACLLPHDLI